MNFPDVIAAGQSAAITVVFIYLSYKFPAIIQNYWMWQEKYQESQQQEAEKIRRYNSAEAIARREYDAKERDNDRTLRHEVVERFQKIIMEMDQTFQKVIIDLLKQHKEDSKLDRDAEDRRMNLLVDRLEQVVRNDACHLPEEKQP